MNSPMTATASEVPLSCGDTRARVALHGAELCGWRHAGRELLWPGDARWWPRRCPVLFPIVGRLCGGETRVGGKAYRMGVHGFASAQPFSVQQRSGERVSLLLESNADTRAAYPFDFRLTVEYRAQPDGVDVALTVQNTGDAEMPFAIGLHPGFRWPFYAPSRAGHSIVFEQREEPWVPVVTADGLLSQELRAVPLDYCAPTGIAGRARNDNTARNDDAVRDGDTCRLLLEPALFEREALCFLRARSRSVRFESPEGSAISLRAENFAHWALWSRPGAPFVSIEAWTGYGDAPGFGGELADKPSMTRLAPGASSRHRVELRCEAPRETT